MKPNQSAGSRPTKSPRRRRCRNAVPPSRRVTPGPALVKAALQLRAALEHLTFSSPVTHTYNPLQYAWRPHEEYIRRFATAPRRVVFLGMNPGPFGMMQTGVPFGEVNAVRDWMRVEGPVEKPALEHPRRPIEGFACERSEVSGRRLWGLFAKRFPRAEDFFEDHFVVNYCPLVFLEASGRNRTPDKLPAAELGAVTDACDRHLCEVVALLQPRHLIGVGAFAARQATQLFGESPVRIGQILHPSPASPAANRDWPGQATAQLEALGVW